MDPYRTAVRLGSITKSFTALAVLHAADEGRIDLEAPARRYLPQLDTASITVRDLLTHRGRFDTDETGFGVDLGSSIELRRDLLGRYGRRVGPRDGRFQYDNVGYALLGEIAAEVSGETYAQVVGDSVFRKLGMNKSAIGIPVEFKPRLAGCYRLAAEGLERCTHQVLRDGLQGAGDATSTAADMARFMLAALDATPRERGGLLAAASWSEFLTPRFKSHPNQPGVSLGTYELAAAGHNVVGHSGVIRGANSLYLLFPKQDLGVFVHMNVDMPLPELTLSGVIEAAQRGQNDFDTNQNIMFGLPQRLTAKIAGATSSARPHAATGCRHAEIPGLYRLVPLQATTGFGPRLLTTLLVPSERAALLPNGQLRFGEIGTFLPVSPCTFELPRVDAHYRAGDTVAPELTFVTLKSGDLIAGWHPLMSYEKVAWYQNPSVTVLPWVSALCFLIVAGIGANLAPPSARRSLRLASLSAVVLLACLGLEAQWGVSLWRTGANDFAVISWRVLLHLALGVLGLATLLSWLNAAPGVRAKILTVCLCVCTLVSIASAAYWGLLGQFF